MDASNDGSLYKSVRTAFSHIVRSISSHKIISVSIVVLIAGITAAGIWAYKTGDEREERRAWKRLDKDAVEVLGVGLADGGLNALLNDLICGQMHADYRLDISGIPGIPYTVGTDGTLDRDAVKKQMSAHTDLSVMNYQVHHADIYAQGQQAYISMQDEENGDYTIDFGNISGVINSSEKMQEIGVSVPDGFMIDIFPEQDKIAKILSPDDSAGEYPDTALLLSGDDTDIIIETDNKHDIRSICGTIVWGGDDGARPSEQTTVEASSAITTAGLEVYESTYQISLDGERIPLEHLTVTVDNIPAKYLFNTEETEDVDLYVSFSPGYDAASDTLEIICDRMVLSASGEDFFRMKGSMHISRQAGRIDVLKPEKTGELDDLIADIHYEIENSR